MNIRTIVLSKRFDFLIKNIVLIEDIYHSDTFTKTIIPYGSAELVFQLAGNFQYSFDAVHWIDQPPVILSHQVTKAIWAKSTQYNYKVLAISIRPPYGKLFFDEPASTLSNKIIDLTLDLDGFFMKYHHQLISAPDFVTIASILENLFHKLLMRKETVIASCSMVNEIIQYIQIADKARFDDAKRNINLSWRRIEQIFLEDVGICPRQYFKKNRFQRALQFLMATPDCSLTELALRAGYYDQAQMIHDFKSFAKQSPKKLMQNPDVIGLFK